MASDAIVAGLMALRPVLPAQDFAQSRAFYEALGFSAWPIGEHQLHMQIGDRDGLFCFVLQDAYARDWAENAAMILTVRALDAWWEVIAALDLPAAFGVAEPVAPQWEPWGLRMAYFRDPAGVSWQLVEQADGFPVETYPGEGLKDARPSPP